MSFRSTRPDANEHHSYYSRYVDRVPDGDVIETLERQRDETLAFLASLPAEKADHRYAPEKWSVAQVVRHMIDTEWIFAGRVLSFARALGAPLPGMEPDDFMAAVSDAELDLPSLVDELRHLRSADLALFGRLPEVAWNRRGIASEREFTVRALVWIVAGHTAHHVAVLRERYL